MIDLGNMTMVELQKLLQEVEQAIIKRKSEEREAVIKNVMDLVNQSGFSFAELFPAGQVAVKKTRRASVVLPRYKDPDTEATWTGRGRKPIWVVKYLEAGGSLENIAIQN